MNAGSSASVRGLSFPFPGMFPQTDFQDRDCLKSYTAAKSVRIRIIYLKIPENGVIL